MTFEDWWGIRTPYDNPGSNMLARSHAREGWKAGRENMQEYQKYEFCLDMECRYLKNETCVEPLVRPDATPYGCPFTAKGFHHWLKKNGYRIAKRDGE